MEKAQLGKLERVDIRRAWAHEAKAFTPWLAEAENLALLGQELGLELELEDQEIGVGVFRADLLCRDINSGQLVLIENQLERTNHSHLGQLLTYAAGLQVATIIWIAERFTEEHQVALNWLNQNTHEDLAFFGIEIELWKIGESLPAPKFSIVSQPNSWSRKVSENVRRIEERSDLEQLQLAYWTSLKDVFVSYQSSLRIGKPRAQHWMYFSMGRRYIFLVAFINTREKRIGVGIGLKGTHAKTHFYVLEQDKERIEAEIGTSLDWRENPNKSESRIYLHARDKNPLEKEQWSLQQQWMKDHLEKFKKVFGQRIPLLDEQIAHVNITSSLEEQEISESFS